MKLPLSPDPGIQFDHLFVHTPRRVELNTVVWIDGGPWICTWCQPQKRGSGFLIMIVPRIEAANGL